MTPLQACLPDVYELDGVSATDVPGLVAAGYPWAGLIVQASNGLTPAAPTWIRPMWKAMGPQGAPGARYGKDWLRMAYHFYLAKYDPIAQADLFLGTIDAAGGWGDGDLWPGVDIEASAGNPVVGSSGAEKIVVDGITAYAEHILKRTGKRPILYAGSYTRDLGITSRMGCSLLWIPEWASTFNSHLVDQMGWGPGLDATLLWQVCGNTPASVAGYSKSPPLPGVQDYSVMIRANLPYAQGLAWTLSHTGSRPTL